MGMKFKVGQSVKQIVPTVEGKVLSVAIVNDEVGYEVEFTDSNGEQHARFFTEEQLEASEDQSGAPA